MIRTIQTGTVLVQGVLVRVVGNLATVRVGSQTYTGALIPQNTGAAP